ncbi:MAG TPA: 16S rRNA (cytosine(1402)-N(4))-methyltransferase RsmH [Gammaproteobacteria bacterium]|nr:16S rRNA (cytosine(1402)-N(4))-methyltransferase RsmH [Gammaproteobacteria bacterium]
MADDFGHHPVLLEEAMDALAIREEGIYIDGTFGRGGHSGAILRRLGPRGRLLALDKDPEAVQAGLERFAAESRFVVRQGSFTAMEQLVRERGWQGRVAGILLDLGVSSPQLDDARRGFSLRRDGPLDMRMDPGSGTSAARWLAGAGEGEIARVLREYGEERFARRIARRIVARRAAGRPVESTAQLAELVAACMPRREPGKDPATRTFQAIRIHVNRELEELEELLRQVPRMLAPGGRLAVISFHSLEDRLVKRFMRNEARGDRYPPDLPVTLEQVRPRMRLVGRAIRAGAAELARNQRARSAVLRVAERLP